MKEKKRDIIRVLNIVACIGEVLLGRFIACILRQLSETEDIIVEINGIIFPIETFKIIVTIIVIVTISCTVLSLLVTFREDSE